MTEARETNRLGGRMRRYAQVSGAVGGLAARFAGGRVFGIRGDPARMATDLRTALGGLKGPLMKVAQMLSTIPNALPREFAEELSQLQSNAPEMGWPFVKRRMAGELGADWQSKFASFEHAAAAAASLGQVHRATLPDGRQLACKLQYPDMASVVEADLTQLRVILSLYHSYDRAIDAGEVATEIADRLREELDYERESRHMRLYSVMLKDESHVHVPEVVADLTTKRLLSMTWLEGERITAFVDAHQDRRDAIAHTMFRAWYVPFYYYGVIHGDPHLGNYTVRPGDDEVNLLDFGCIRIFPPGFVKGVIDLYHALDRDDRALAVHAFESWGFGNLSTEVIDVLMLWARYVYGPLLDDRRRAIQDHHGSYGVEVAEKVHKELGRIGGVRPPREFVLMDRAAIGLGSVFLRLKAEINWSRLFQELIEDFDEAALERRQTATLTEAGLR